MTKIKICGIRNLSDAIVAIDAGADMLGFNFYPLSPRSISVENCRQINSILKQEYPQILRVGVFVNLEALQIKNIMDDCFLNLAQLHGDESPVILSEFSGNAFKAFRGVPTESTIKDYLSSGSTRNPAFLLDASVQGQYGGSGITSDWNKAAELAKLYPLLLAGGLKPENVTDAITQVQPWGVDTASGVESTPGKKDKSKMLDFVKAVKSCFF
jgi:phosphoribosylanthranilate isomerase